MIRSDFIKDVGCNYFKMLLVSTWLGLEWEHIHILIYHVEWHFTKYNFRIYILVTVTIFFRMSTYVNDILHWYIHICPLYHHKSFHILHCSVEICLNKDVSSLSYIFHYLACLKTTGRWVYTSRRMCLYLYQDVQYWIGYYVRQ